MKALWLKHLNENKEFLKKIFQVENINATKKITLLNQCIDIHVCYSTTCKYYSQVWWRQRKLSSIFVIKIHCYSVFVIVKNIIHSEDVSILINNKQFSKYSVVFHSLEEEHKNTLWSLINLTGSSKVQFRLHQRWNSKLLSNLPMRSPALKSHIFPILSWEIS